MAQGRTGDIGSDLLFHTLALELEDGGRIVPGLLLALVQCGSDCEGGGVAHLLLHAQLARG